MCVCVCRTRYIIGGVHVMDRGDTPLLGPRVVQYTVFSIQVHKTTERIQMGFYNFVYVNVYS